MQYGVPQLVSFTVIVVEKYKDARNLKRGIGQVNPRSQKECECYMDALLRNVTWRNIWDRWGKHSKIAWAPHLGRATLDGPMILQETDLPGFPLADPWFYKRIEAQQPVFTPQHTPSEKSVLFSPFPSVPTADLWCTMMVSCTMDEAGYPQYCMACQHNHDSVILVEYSVVS